MTSCANESSLLISCWCMMCSIWQATEKERDQSIAFSGRRFQFWTQLKGVRVAGVYNTMRKWVGRGQTKLRFTMTCKPRQPSVN